MPNGSDASFWLLAAVAVTLFVFWEGLSAEAKRVYRKRRQQRKERQ